MTTHTFTSAQELKLIIGGKEQDPRQLSWFVVQCSHRAELTIVEALAEVSISAYCPAETRWRTTIKGRDRYQLALLPGYLFVGLARDWHGDYPFPAVRAVQGVVGILGAAGAPIEVPYSSPDPEFLRHDRTKRPPLFIAELRDMEERGAFDLTRENGLTEVEQRKARQTLKGFQDLGDALGDAFMGRPREQGRASGPQDVVAHPFGPTYKIA